MIETQQNVTQQNVIKTQHIERLPFEWNFR